MEENLHVELSTGVGGGDVKTDGLTTEKVRSSSDAAWDPEGEITAIRIDGISSPRAAGETGLVDLEPSKTSDGSGLRVADLSHVDNLRPGMGTSVPLGGHS